MAVEELANTEDNETRQDPERPDPKPENSFVGKLRSRNLSWFLKQRGEPADGRAETQRRNDFAGAAGSRVRRNGGGSLPEAQDQPADVLPVQEEVWGLGLRLSELTELRQLREENGKLKRLGDRFEPRSAYSARESSQKAPSLGCVAIWRSGLSKLIS